MVKIMPRYAKNGKLVFRVNVIGKHLYNWFDNFNSANHYAIEYSQNHRDAIGFPMEIITYLVAK